MLFRNCGAYLPECMVSNPRKFFTLTDKPHISYQFMDSSIFIIQEYRIVNSLVIQERLLHFYSEVLALVFKRCNTSSNRMCIFAAVQVNYPLSYGVPVRERYGSTLLPATREQHDQNCTQSH